jgi:hypothetical protein
MIAVVTAWLSFWNAVTRRELKEELHGEFVGSIYVPFGEGEIGRGDVIYCVAVEDGELHLLTRVVVASLMDDPGRAQSVRVEPDGDVPATDYDRVVPADMLDAIRVAYADGSERGITDPGGGGPYVAGHRFQGRSSLRQLAAGAAELDSLLGVFDANPSARAVNAVRALADDYEEALNFLEDFCERFYWIKDHPDYQAEVREFLTLRGREPRGLG